MNPFSDENLPLVAKRNILATSVIEHVKLEGANFNYVKEVERNAPGLITSKTLDHCFTLHDDVTNGKIIFEGLHKGVVAALAGGALLIIYKILSVLFNNSSFGLGGSGGSGGTSSIYKASEKPRGTTEHNAEIEEAGGKLIEETRVELEELDLSGFSNADLDESSPLHPGLKGVAGAANQILLEPIEFDGIITHAQVVSIEEGVMDQLTLDNALYRLLGSKGLPLTNYFYVNKNTLLSLSQSMINCWKAFAAMDLDAVLAGTSEEAIKEATKFNQNVYPQLEVLNKLNRPIEAETKHNLSEAALKSVINDVKENATILAKLNDEFVSIFEGKAKIIESLPNVQVYLDELKNSSETLEGIKEFEKFIGIVGETLKARKSFDVIQQIRDENFDKIEKLKAAIQKLKAAHDKED